MSYIQFESGRVKDAEREEIRRAREKILEKAEADYNRKQAQKEQARLRGDDQWMLPSVESKISSDKKVRKKRKKDKKEKKSSKKKKKKRSKSSSSSSSSDSEDEQWVEKSIVRTEQSAPSPPLAAQQQKTVERDEWMNLPGLFPCVTRSEIKKSKNLEKDEEKDKCILDTLGQSERELNPYWKNGGTGLPQTKEGSAGNLMDVRWLKKSLQRAQEQAEEQGRSLEEVAAERWGSLEKLKSMIADAESNKSHRSYSSRNSQTLERTKGFMGSKYDDDGDYHQDDRKDSKGRNRRDRSNDLGREKRRSRSKSTERRRSRSKDRSRRSRSKEHRARPRSRSRERLRWSDRYQSDRYRNGFNSEQRKPAFKKPSEDDNSHAGTSKQSSSGRKSWRKPNSKETTVQRELENPKVKLESSESTTDTEPEENAQKEEEKIPTEAEMNQLGAKIIKAEIMGDDELAAELKAKLERAREARKNAPARPTTGKEEEPVILTRIDAGGMTRPVEPRSQYEEPKGGRRKKKKVDTHASGERVRYFADDDKYTLQQMFQHEKGRSTNDDDDAMFTKIAAKSMDMDEMFEQRVCREESDAKQDERERMQAIKQHETMSRSLDNCTRCVDSKQMLKHMILAMGSKVYLSLPSHGSLTTGHCILAPIHHVICQTQLDEDVWEELQTFRKALTKMFMAQDEDVVFFETSMGHRKFPHMQLECVPMPKEIGDMAPIYFKKALLECETEWSTNKKVVDLSKKDVRRAIPKGLPYFAVDFGLQGGFAHVIEDENMFPKNFAQEIIGGMLDLDHSLWRKPRRENFDKQRRKVMEFSEMWGKYDFTTKNDSD